MFKLQSIDEVTQSHPSKATQQNEKISFGHIQELSSHQYDFSKPKESLLTPNSTIDIKVVNQHRLRTKYLTFWAGSGYYKHWIKWLDRDSIFTSKQPVSRFYYKQFFLDMLTNNKLSNLQGGKEEISRMIQYFKLKPNSIATQ